MVVLAIDRSTDVPSIALAADGQIAGRIFEGENARSANWPEMVKGFLSEHRLSFCDLEHLVVGTGPGSFAGIRGALAFAQGLAIGIRAKRPESSADPVVYGLPSASALAQDEGLTAVVGDARRGLFWVVVYEGARMVTDFRIVTQEEIAAAVPETAAVTTPDGVRIGALLAKMFGMRFRGGRSPSAERLVHLAVAYPEALVPEPLPIYLSPAVRT